MSEPAPAQAERPEPRIHVAPSPHLSSTATTQWMMLDVLIGLLPVMAMAAYFFGLYAFMQVGICVVSCMAFEALFNGLRGRSASVLDGSAAVAGAILGLSLPWNAPWYAGVVGALVAIAVAKLLFGGLGHNIFNPAMVGRTFVMISFSVSIGSAAYVAADAPMEVVTQASPLSIAKEAAAAAELPDLWAMFIGNVNGSLGETSSLACLIGGLWLILRRSAAWRTPAGSIVGLAAVSLIAQLIDPQSLTMLQHLVGGAFLFGAFFIATDPVTSPVTPRGQWIFGIGYGVLVFLIRQYSAYPEGVAFAILLMNALAPLINRWTIPTPVGGPAPAPVKK